MRMTNPNMPRQPVVRDPRRPKPMGTPTPPKTGTANLPQLTPKPKGPMSQYMRDGGMATKNKGVAMKHGGMAHGTKAKKGRGMAIMIAIGKPKGRGK